VGNDAASKLLAALLQLRDEEAAVVREASRGASLALE
jgi:hypothetical protein